MISKHIIIEGLPATGKSEISNLLKIYFPANLRILSELTTTIVQEHKFNILEERNRMTELLKIYLGKRLHEIKILKDEFSKNKKDLIILEESHLGVHWAYSKVVNDKYFLNEYENFFKINLYKPDFYIRLYISPELSYKRQIARNTPDVEVTPNIIAKMFNHLIEWHTKYSSKKVYEINADRTPELVVKEVIKLTGLCYEGEKVE